MITVRWNRVVNYSTRRLCLSEACCSTDAVQRSYNAKQIIGIKSFNEDHRLNAMLMMEVRSSSVKNSSSKVFGYLPDRGGL
ncbi:MAG: hypothetical protein ACLTZT_02810 [Butyricimonas faecalis]